VFKSLDCIKRIYYLEFKLSYITKGIKKKESINRTLECELAKTFTSKKMTALNISDVNNEVNDQKLFNLDKKSGRFSCHFFTIIDN